MLLLKGSTDLPESGDSWLWMNTRVVGIMHGGGVAKNGIDYDQTYCQIFTIREGKISELHEFFDTVLAEAALFDNKLERPEREPELPFEF
jgi:uncharacterized protein